MDEATRQGRQGAGNVSGPEQQRSPEEIRRDIEQTRGELGDTVEELAAKADVKGRARQRFVRAKDTAQQKKDEFVSKAQSASPDSASAGAQQVTSKAQQNPLPFAVGGALVAGFILGRITAR